MLADNLVWFFFHVLSELQMYINLVFEVFEIYLGKNRLSCFTAQTLSLFLMKNSKYIRDGF